MIDNLHHSRTNPRSPLRTTTDCISTVLVLLLACQVATASTLPMQNQLDPRHLDLDPNPAGMGVVVAPGATYEQSFADALNSAEDWYAEFLIGNPTANAVAFDASLVWPGGGTQGPGLLLPGAAFVLKVEPADIPETLGNWKFKFTNPLSSDLVVDASVSEALSISSTPPDTGFGFTTLSGEPIDDPNNSFDPGGDIGPSPVGVEIVPGVPEPTALVLALFGAFAGLLMRRRRQSV